MHALSLLASVMVANIIPQLTYALPEPFADKDSDHHYPTQKCLGDHESRDILQRYVNTFEVLDEAVVNQTFTEHFKYESDSTSFFLQLEPGTVTWPSRSVFTAALRADQTTGPAFKVTINLYTHTCDTIVFKYHIFGGRVQPSAVGGIDWLFVDLESRKIESALSEFNSAALLYNLGFLGKPNATECLNGACEGEGKMVEGCGGRR